MGARRVILFNPFTRRIRGFRVLDIAFVALIVSIAVASYAFKTFAGAEDADASGVETRILQEQKRIRLLDAEIARLEDPRRIEDLSTRYLSLAAVAPSHDIGPDGLAKVAVQSADASAAPKVAHP
jgi:hypothetical protein